VYWFLRQDMRLKRFKKRGVIDLPFEKENKKKVAKECLKIHMLLSGAELWFKLRSFFLR